MRVPNRFLSPALLCTLLCSAALAQGVILRDASEIKFPGKTDCNSPVHWDGQTMYLFNSVGHPTRSSGKDQFSLGAAERCNYDNEVNGGRWIECTYRADDGTLYGWYHHEPHGLCPGTHLTAPKIGAVRSTDNGANWTDLGIILESRPESLDCSYANNFFAGGNGDFCAMVDPAKRYIYFFISTYADGLDEQGVSVARMLFADRDKPVGKVWKYRDGKWYQPGLGGRVGAIFPARISWAKTNADAFWGPSVHWNTYLQTYVMLLNRTRYKPGWPQEGIYISFNSDLANPKGWTYPLMILKGGGWYPQVIGVDAMAKETDKLCGRRARFYMHGVSRHEILFLRKGDDPNKLPAVFVP